MTKIYDNSGALFKNKKMRDGKKDPEYTGQMTVNGQEFWLSAWVKEGQDVKFFSISVKPKEQKQETKPRPKTQSHHIDSEIPF